MRRFSKKNPKEEIILHSLVCMRSYENGNLYLVGVRPLGHCIKLPIRSNKHGFDKFADAPLNSFYSILTVFET